MLKQLAIILIGKFYYGISPMIFHRILNNLCPQTVNRKVFNLIAINQASESELNFNVTKTNFPEDFEKNCGNGWQVSYMKSHDESLGGKFGSRYVVSIPVWTGLADNILGYVSAFMWALLNGASYHIASIDSFFDRSRRPIQTGFESPFIQWNRLHFVHSEHFECLLPVRARYYGKIHMDAVYTINCSDGTLVSFSGERLNYTHVMGVNDNKVLQKNFLQKSNHQIYFIASNRGHTFGIFDNPEYSKVLRGYGLTRHTLFPCLFNFLFKIREDVCSSACQRTVAMLKANQRSDRSIVRIGIQIRNSIQTTCHFHCIDQLLKKYDSTANGNKREVILLLICSDFEVQRVAKERYGSRLLLPEGEPYNVTTVSDRLVSSKNLTEIAEQDKRAMREAARDMYLLSLTDIKVVSDRSGFGLLGSVIRPQRRYRIITMDHDGKMMRNCSYMSESGGDPLLKFAYQWSGLR